MLLLVCLVLSNAFFVLNSPITSESKQVPNIQQSVYPYSQNNFKENENNDAIDETLIDEDIDDSNEGVSENPLKPRTEDLTIITERIYSDENSDIKKDLTDPTDGDWSFRGSTITVSGRLWSGVPGDNWDSETVTLFYNVTKSQYEGDPVTYNGNPQYEVNSTITDAAGIFTFQFTTSFLSANPFSKVGKINLLTWFDGNPSRGRGAGSPGQANVTYYGRLKLEVIDSVTNPGPASYSFTTQLLFDNNTVVSTQGTQYLLRVDWDTDGIHTNQNYTFAVTNQHVYSNTAPITVQSVTYEAWYNFAPLSYNFFVKQGASNPVTASKVIYKTIQRQTESQVVVDAYYVTGAGLSKIPQEIQIESTFTIYANLTSGTGLEELEYIKVIYFYQGIGNYSYMKYQTNITDAAIQFTVTLNSSTIDDITKIFRIFIEPAATSFPDPAKRTGESLNSILIITVNTISVTIDNPSSNFYTSGHSIDYDVYVQDSLGNPAPSSSFQVDFPGLGIHSYTASVTGYRAITDTIPSYAVIDQTQSKIITVTALNVTGPTYKYYVYGTVDNTDSFNLYFSLTLALTAPNNSIVLDGSTWTEFNSSFWQVLGQRDYQLVVEDQWLRNPIGATIYLELTGGSSTVLKTFDVTLTDNWVNFSFADFLAAGLLTTHAYSGLSLVAGGGDYTPETTITQTVNIYGPDNDDPTITFVGLSPDPYDPGIHDPYYNITVTVSATDVGTGIRYVELNYRILEADNTTVAVPWTPVKMNPIGGDIYEIVVNTTVAYSQYFVQYYIIAKDFAGHGLDDLGAKQTNPIYYYDVSFGMQDMVYSQSEPDFYQVGDVEAPIEEAPPTLVESSDPLTPYLNITVYVNDTRVFSGMDKVEIWVYFFDNATGILVNPNGDPIVAEMYNTPGTNEWFIQLPGIYNYDIVWLYAAYDSASPNPNIAYGTPTVYSVVEFVPPTVSNLIVDYDGTVVLHDSVVTFNATITDAITGVSNVTLLITYNGVDYTINMSQVGTTSLYTASFNLADIPLDSYGTYTLQYQIFAEDAVGNNVTTTMNSLSVLYQNPRGGPGGFTGSWGAIIGGAAGALVAIIAVLFLWINRHTIQTFAKKQTFRRRLRDYLREIIEDIKKDGLEGRYKEGILKTWRVVEGIGREFYNLPRYRSQTPMEFSRLLAQRGKIERELLYTLLEYFTKARYGYEEITEKDFNSGVRALLKIVDKIEVGEMQIES
jgi:hypothetical protein